MLENRDYQEIRLQVNIVTSLGISPNIVSATLLSIASSHHTQCICPGTGALKRWRNTSEASVYWQRRWDCNLPACDVMLFLFIKKTRFLDCHCVLLVHSVVFGTIFGYTLKVFWDCENSFGNNADEVQVLEIKIPSDYSRPCLSLITYLSCFHVTNFYWTLWDLFFYVVTFTKIIGNEFYALNI